MADLHFERATDLASVLWQNGLLGYVDEAGRRRFYSMGDIEQFHFPPEVDTYVLHPCLVHAVGGIRHVREDSEWAAIVRHTVPFAAGRAQRLAPRLRRASRRRCRRRHPRCCPRVTFWPQPGAPGTGPGGGAVVGPDQATEYAVGDVIDGRFEVLQLLGRGGFSKVYRVRDDARG